MLAGMLGGDGGTDYSQFTTDPVAHQAASDALAPYGLAPLEASQVQRNSILPNTGFFGNHPRLSGALEGGIYGALAAHGGNTVGESIQGALEGLVGGRQLQQAAYNRQFAKPFEAANAMEHLEDLQQKRDLQDAEIQHYRAMNQKLGRPDHDFHAVPMTKSDQGYMSYDTTTGKSEYVKNPDYDPALVTRQTRANEWSGYGTDRTAIAQELYPNKGPHELTQSEMANVNSEFERRMVTRTQDRSKAGGEGRKEVPGALTDTQKENISTIRSQMNKLDSKETTSLLRQEVLLDPKFAGKSLSEINKEVENRREGKRQTFQNQIDKITNPGSASTSPIETPITNGTTDHLAGGAVVNAQGDPSLIRKAIKPPAGTPKKVLVEGTDF